MSTLGPAPRDLREPSRAARALAVVAVWVGLFLLLRGRLTLPLGAAQLTDLHRGLNGLADAVAGARDGRVLALLDPVRAGLDGTVGLLRDAVSRPSGGRPVPQIGWFGVTAAAAWLALLVGGARVAVLTAVGGVLLGVQGLFSEALDTLALTLTAVVICVLVGVPLGVWTGRSPRVARLVTPVLDLLQTMPTLVYLAPLTVLFLIGPAAATIATVLYALPPVVRLTAHGVRGVPAEAVEAATSLGASRAQALCTVVLPLARPSIVLGVNQTSLAALSMATIAALIDAPGLGQVVVQALQTLDVGTAVNAGLGIVVLAVVLDRTTTAASTRAARARRRGADPRVRRVALAAGAVGALAAVELSRTYLWAATFPPQLVLGRAFAAGADRATGAVQDALSGVTGALQSGVTRWLLDPLETLLTQSPWPLVAAGIVALAVVLAGLRAAAGAAVCLALLVGTGVWSDAMSTLAATLVATVAVVTIGVVAGTWTGRSPHADALVRPLLDAGQTLPAFVYLVPFLALFGASRFTAIVAAVVYAAPVAIKIVADGVRAVPPAAVEAAQAVGSTRWQVIAKVQLPLSRRALALATNQGLVHVLAMVVVGGLVGAGALGYDVVAGFSQTRLFGKGLAAGVAIVLLGILLDRITQAAAARTGRRYAPPEARPRRRPRPSRSADRRGSQRGLSRAHLSSSRRRPRRSARDGAGRRPGRLRRGADRAVGGGRALRRLGRSVRERVRHRQPGH